MSVPDVVEEVDLVFPREQSRPDRVDRCIAPSLVVETARFVQMFEELHIRLRSPEVQVA